MSRAVERPRRGLWRAEIVRAVLSGHSILGISFAAVIYLVCLTGAISVFLRDFQRWEQPAAPVMATASDRAVARAVTAMGARVGPDKPFYVSLPTADYPQLVLSSGDDADDETWIADVHGRLAMPQHAPWIQFVQELHVRLHLPETWGRFIVGLAGVALFSSLISGVLAHPRVFRDAFHLRLGGLRRLEQADLHNRLGVWPLPFHIVVTLTGALLGLSTIIVGVLALLLFRGDATKVYALLAPPPPIADPRPAPMPDIASLLTTARQRAPGAEPNQFTISHWGRRDMRLDLSAHRPRLIAQQDSFSFDVNGKVVAEKHPAAMTTGERILGSLGPLHFGWFGGLPIRIVYGLLGIALCVVTSSGINVWLARRRDKGRAAPGWERVWVAISWGQPLALAATMLFSVLIPSQATAPTLTAAWLALTIALVLGAALAGARLVPRAVSRIAKRCTGGLIAAAVIWMAMANGIASGLIWWLIILFLLAAALFWPPRRSQA